MIYIPSIRIGGSPCNTDCVSGPCGETPDDPCDPPPDYPVFDEETGLWKCGPYPNTYLGPLLDNFGGNWNFTFPQIQLQAQFNYTNTIPFINRNINIAANTARYIVWEIFPKGTPESGNTSFETPPCLITFSGKTFLVTPQATTQYYVTECPYTTTAGPYYTFFGTQYGTPQLPANSWQVEATVKTGLPTSLFLTMRVYLWGYSP